MTSSPTYISAPVFNNDDLARVRLPRVGDVVELLWDGPEGAQWYSGKLVKRVKKGQHVFSIAYEDGDEVVQDLNEETLRIPKKDLNFEPGMLKELFEEKTECKKRKRLEANGTSVAEYGQRKKKLRTFDHDATNQVKYTVDHHGKDSQSAANVNGSEDIGSDERIMTRMASMDDASLIGSVATVNEIDRADVHPHLSASMPSDAPAWKDIPICSPVSVSMGCLPPRKRKAFYGSICSSD